MNKIFSKVWNRLLGQLVVASEHASRRPSGTAGSGVSRKSSLRRLHDASTRKGSAVATAILMACGLLGASSIQAQTVVGTTPSGPATGTATGTGSIAIGGGDAAAQQASTGANTNAIAIGAGAAAFAASPVA